MASPEHPSAGAERAKEAGLLHETLGAFEKTLGPEVRETPTEISTEWIRKELQDITKDGRIDTYNEQSRYNELFYRQAVLERQHELQSAQSGNRRMDPVKLQELIVADQAVAYHVYFREAQNHVLSVLRRYETLRKNVPHVPAKILQMEADTQRFVAALQQATQERVDYSNVLLRDPHASLVRANQLNQRIIDILAGKHGLQGIKEGFVPKQMFLELLKYEYKRLLDQQKEIARDPTLINAQTEMRKLELKHALAEEKKGEFTEEDKTRHDELQSRIKAVDAQFKELGGKRREITEQIITLTDELGSTNIQQEEVAAIQEQFGKKFSFEGVQGVNPLTTPPDVREAIAANMETRKAHHLKQMNGFLSEVNTEVLAKGLGLRVEKLWNEKGREAVRLVTHRLAAFFTFAVPETFGMKEAARDALTAPLDEALGWPAGKDDWLELTDEEKKTVREKATSILDLIEKFDRTKVQNFQETITLVQKMKPASTYTLENVKFDEAGQPIVPSERVTAGNIDELTRKPGGAAVYLMLMRQLQQDFGSDQPPAGFMGAYADFLHKVDGTIDVHLDMGRALHILSKRFDDLMKWLIAAAIAAGFAAGVLTTWLLSKGVRITAGGLWKGAKGLARLPGKLIRPSGVGAAAEAPAAAAGTTGISAVEKVAEGASRTSRIGRVLGPIGITLVAADLVRVMRRDARLQPLQELNGIQAAIELWNNDKMIDTTAPRHGVEMRFLERRLQCFVMEDGSNLLLQTLEKEKQSLSGDRKARAEQLQGRSFGLREKAKEVKNKYTRFFPITDYLVTDPKRPAGNVGVNWRGLDEARQRGWQSEERFRQIELQSREEFSQSLRKEYEKMQKEYDNLLGDAAEFLEVVQKERNK